MREKRLGTSIRLPPALKAKLVAVAKADRRSVSETIIYLIELGLRSRQTPLGYSIVWRNINERSDD